MITRANYKSHALGGIFRQRVDYCRRLAALKAGSPSLGQGWRALALARLGPIFAPPQEGGPGAKPAKLFRKFVLDVLNGVKQALEAILPGSEPIREVRRILVRVFSCG